jgi:hypothetical protein
MTDTPGIGKFRVILPEIWNFLWGIKSLTGICCFSYHCYTYLILSIISGLKKKMMQIGLFFIRNFCFDAIGNFFSSNWEKGYVLPLGT